MFRNAAFVKADKKKKSKKRAKRQNIYNMWSRKKRVITRIHSEQKYLAHQEKRREDMKRSCTKTAMEEKDLIKAWKVAPCGRKQRSQHKVQVGKANRPRSQHWRDHPSS